MNIVFNLLDVGLGNNGGSRTLVRMASELNKMGVCASICATEVAYRLTDLSGVEIVKTLPAQCDAIVATGYRSVASTLSYTGATRKYYYVRGFETWQASPESLHQSYRSGMGCIANCRWLTNYITDLGVPCALVYQGVDFDDWRSGSIKRYPIVGGLFSARGLKRHHEVLKAAGLARQKSRLLGRDVIATSTQELGRYYNGISVWMSPSENEGLQNCPMEAGLCGCALLLSNHPHNGTDYGVDGVNCLRYPAGDLRAAAAALDQLKDTRLRETLHKNLVEFLRETVGTKADAAKRFLKAVT